MDCVLLEILQQHLQQFEFWYIIATNHLKENSKWHNS